LRSETRVTTGNAANAVKAQVLQPLVNRDLANDAIPLLTTVNAGELIGSYWTGANVCPGNSLAWRPPVSRCRASRILTRSTSVGG
jgi:hypothetical protein